MDNPQKQGQTAGDHSIAIQAGRDVHVGLITVSEAREIALGVFKANALELAGLARDLFELRGREFIERYLEELQRRRPGGLDSFRDPDMLHTIFTAQRDYARIGAQNLAQLLIDLLIQRSTAANLRQIVLNEATAVAAKLTDNQLDLLSFTLLFVHYAPLRFSFDSLAEFGEYLRKHVSPLLNEDFTQLSTYLHLDYTGCISMDSWGCTIIARIQDVFPGCFTQGFQLPAGHPGFKSQIQDLFIPCFHDAGALQLRPMDEVTLDEVAHSRGVPNADLAAVVTDERVRMLEVSNAFDLLCKLDPKFQFLLSPTPEPPAFDGPLSKIQLTSVGIALANANIRRRTGLEFDLAQWTIAVSRVDPPRIQIS
jgi:hypothetical protein